MNLVLLEDRTHRVVAADLALVFWILEVVGTDVFPYALHGLRAGELIEAVSGTRSMKGTGRRGARAERNRLTWISPSRSAESDADKMSGF